jgi:hypothetical protein
MMQTMTEVEQDTETLDVSKLTWQRPTHIHETMTGPPTMTPWKALCGAVLYDIIPQNDLNSHKPCDECVHIFLELARAGKVPTV